MDSLPSDSFPLAQTGIFRGQSWPFHYVPTPDEWKAFAQSKADGSRLNSAISGAAATALRLDIETARSAGNALRLDAEIARGVAAVPFRTLQALGFIGDGVASDRAPIQAFVDTHPGDIHITFPDGVVIGLDGPVVTAGNRNVHLDGRATFVMLVANQDAWHHGVGAPGVGRFTAENLIFRPHQSGGSTALLLSFIGATNPISAHFSIRNCVFGFEGAVNALGAAASWQVGLKVAGAWNSGLEDCQFMMPNAGSGTTATGVWFTGAEGVALANPYSTALTINGTIIQGGANAVLVTGKVQGVHISTSNLVGCDYGVNWPGGTNDGGDLLTLAASHINSRLRGIYCSNVLTVQTSGGLYMIHFGPDPAASAPLWCAIELVEPGKSSLTGLNVLGIGADGRSERGIWLHGTGVATHYPSIITGNVMQTINGPAVLLEVAVSKVFVVGNTFETGASVVQNLSVDSTGNFIGPNVIAGMSDWQMDYVTFFLRTLHGISCSTLVVAGGIEVGAAGGGTNIDWHGVDGNDFDFRAICQNGTVGTNGKGDLYLQGRRLYVQSELNALLGSYANDAAAAAAGVAVNGLYRNGNVVQIRIG